MLISRFKQYLESVQWFGSQAEQEKKRFYIYLQFFQWTASQLQALNDVYFTATEQGLSNIFDLEILQSNRLNITATEQLLRITPQADQR